MFPPMRRRSQQLTQPECISILERNTSGVLALSGVDDYPYAVPLSYVYHDGRLFFHCALTGHKLDSIARNSKASFCVIDQDRVIPQRYTTQYRSVIAFGRARVLTDEEEEAASIRLLAAKYSPDIPREDREAAIQKDYDHLCMVELSIEHLTGKEGRELTQARPQP